MSLNKPNLTTKALKVAVNLPIFMALLSNLALPSIVKADIEQEMANSTQKMAFTGIKAPEVAKMPKKLASAAGGLAPDKVLDAVITAYTSTPGQTDDTPFIAASGKRVHDGMIAANGLPFGTQIVIPELYGDKVFVVEDRMNRRYGLGRMDIWLDTTRAEAMKFGVKRVEVLIFYPKKAVAKVK
ncbi:MAG: hypothetical protein A2534_01460 [Candidatus Magasanikbacteria bacterium RIFOXYD2_FULL_39_9]|uniref:3D domain-containing protein n=1 Tax=Candidatus Magasanikbacteria bacterium RIFOXYD1_FULL_40_23 TaxID=1798705 RepID=A0A1F6P9F1_9BACT|nr:MAG: hypothetical protein A2534_01460 [Candidatus Magasanikbacteria bacterium RIFOXYD2_FULL_39_9]OGH92554.1 MAG: hypothetical protein A2563_02650 [Candidatus Magasanikbacteria bacterium RIFOXYD1_FULL_40_23]